MIDYKFIGTRLREARLAKGMTQEQLANAVDVGTTHISHIETGNTIPSIKTFVDIVNTLGCSADEVLCLELDKSRPIFTSFLSEQLQDCTEWELKIVAETVLSLKDSLRKFHTEE